MRCDDGLRGPAFVLEHVIDSFDTRRNDGQAVRPTLFVAIIDCCERIVRHVMDTGAIEWQKKPLK